MIQWVANLVASYINCTESLDIMQKYNESIESLPIGNGKAKDAQAMCYLVNAF